MIKNLILAVLTFLFGGQPKFHPDNPHGAYRTPGELEEISELLKPIKQKKTPKWLQHLKEGLSNMSYDNFLDKTWKTLWGLGLVGIIGGALFLLANILFTKGNVDYCYIDKWTYVKETNSGVTKPDMQPGVPFDKEKAENKIPGKDQTVVIVYELKGHRNWRDDRNIGRFDSLETAIEGSHKLNCAVEAK